MVILTYSYAKEIGWAVLEKTENRQYKTEKPAFCIYELTHRNNSVACYVIEVRSSSFKFRTSKLYG